MIVNAFHGYSHNYACQAIFHPGRIIGTGIEDYETMERVFGASNALGAIVRHMSPFRRRQFIVMFFTQWDADKYQNLALMLYNNYVQSLEIVKNDGNALDQALQSMKLTTADLDAYDKEEATYIQDVGHEVVWDIHAMEYVEALQELHKLE